MSVSQLGGKQTKGAGHIEVATVTARNAISLGKRKWGMFATVITDPTPANNTTWVLVRGLSDTTKSTNANWQKMSDWLAGLGVGVSTAVHEFFSGNGVTTVFTQSTGALFIVEVSGQIFESGAQYNAVGNVVTFVVAPAVGERVGLHGFSAAPAINDLQALATALLPYLV